MTSPTVGAFSGLSHAELVAAYQACRARSAKLEEALDNLLGSCELNLDDMEPETHELITTARAILTKESTP